ncbi:MAG: class I SAM-dependent methyltransferase [Roseovarius sp.]
MPDDCRHFKAVISLTAPALSGAAGGQEALSSWAGRICFSRAWVRDPQAVATLTPSSRCLANLVSHEVSVEDRPLLELGVGNEVFTRTLLGRGIAPGYITLVEWSAEFSMLLRKEFPGFRLFEMDAARISVGAHYPEWKADTVINRLGLLSISACSVAAILENAFECVADCGSFYQFTHGPRCPVPRSVIKNLHLEVRRVGWSMRNLTPESVYRLRRRTPMRIASTANPLIAADNSVRMHAD